MIFNIFAFGGLFFWTLCILEGIALFCCIANRRGGIATLFLLGFLVVLECFSNFSVVASIVNYPAYWLGGAIGYMLLAVLTALFKWYMFSLDNRQRYNALFAKFIKQENFNPDELNDSQKQKWEDYFLLYRGYQDDGEYHYIEYRPEIGEHKSDIMTWMMFWPIVLIWTMINDPITKIFNWLYHQMVDTLQNISNSVWTGTDSHMPNGKVKR